MAQTDNLTPPTSRKTASLVKRIAVYIVIYILCSIGVDLVCGIARFFRPSFPTIGYQIVTALPAAYVYARYFDVSKRGISLFLAALAAVMTFAQFGLIMYLTVGFGGNMGGLRNAAPGAIPFLIVLIYGAAWMFTAIGLKASKR